jgi:pimeloyl-ACP methyl ester carboxylesterase
MALPDMPPVQYAEVNGVRLAYFEAGPRTGTPIVLCHGWPELAYSWRHQIKALSEAGRWVIAPDQRGYGLSDRPAAIEAYSLINLTGDLGALLDHVGAKKGIFCGHDWGGFVVWQMPLRHPDRVAGVIGVNTPFSPRAPADPIAIMRRRFGDEMYIVHFQTYGEADAILAADVGKSMKFFMRRPMPGTPPATGGLSQDVERPEGQSAFSFIRLLEAYDPTFDPRPKLLTDAEMKVFVDTYERTGFTGGINWYRNFTRNWRESEGVADHVGVPSLMIMAEMDMVLPPSAADGMEAYVPDLEKALIKDSGHWTQQEQPEAVNRVIIDWLDRRFPR